MRKGKQRRRKADRGVELGVRGEVKGSYLTLCYPVQTWIGHQGSRTTESESQKFLEILS